MIKRQSTYAPNTPSPSLAIDKNSQMISKPKPKIRIIHIVAPEIIKTDVEDFRELVQRLTGKPTENKKMKPRKEKRRDLSKHIEFGSSLEFREKVIKGEEEGEIWGGPGLGGGFLGGFADLDGFMQELNDFPLLPMENYGETQLA
ncbi:hypothetical protein LguiA_024671 [Lonicera macranthoides]